MAPAASAAPTAAVPDEALDEATASRLARQGHKSVQVASATTETSELSANADGSKTLIQYVHPVRIRQNGGWVPVDLTLVRQADGSLAPKAAPVGMSFSGGGPGSAKRGPVARLIKDSAEVGINWDADLPTPTVSGATATYTDVLPGVDMQVQAALTGFSQVLVIKTPQAAKNPRLKRITFGSHTKGVKIGAVPRATRVNGKPAKVDALKATNDSGSEVFVGDASRMWDSSGATVGVDLVAGPADGGRQSTMGVEVAEGSVSITPDQSFLADPKTTYPVLLDPDYYCSNCGKTHHVVVQDPWPDAHNFDATGGNLGDLKAGYLNAGSLGSSSAGLSRTYFSMNTAPIIGKIINSATLHAKVISSYSCAPSPTELLLTNGIGWGTTWNAQPGWSYTVSENNRANNAAHCPSDGGADFEAKRAVQDASTNGWYETTFGFKAKNEYDLDTSWRRFDLNPYLEVRYDTPPNPPTDMGIEGWGPNAGDALTCRTGSARSIVFTRTPRLRARLSDPDGGMMDAGFRLFHGASDSYTWNGKDIYTGNVPSGSFAEVTVPAGEITSDGIYTWHLWSGDYQVSSWAPLCEFEVDSVAPNVPEVSSSDYPTSGINGSVGQTGTFTFSPNGNTGLNGSMDVDHYGWSLNNDKVDNIVRVENAQGIAAAPVTPTQSGTNTLYVQAFDRANNPSPTKATYVFNVGDLSQPVGIWKLDETSGGTAADSSGRNRPLTLSGGAAFSAGYTSNALTGNGTSAFAATATPVLDTSRAFSVSAWVKLDKTDSYYTVASQDGDHTSSFFLQYSRDVDRWTMSAVASDNESADLVRVPSAGPPQLGVWTHLLGTYEPTSHDLSLYVNGKLEGTRQATLWNAQGGGFVIGASKWFSARADHFPGTIDQVQAWDRVVDASEAAKIGNAAVLRAQYRLDEQTGTSTKDEVSGQNGTLSGGVTWGHTAIDPDDPNQLLTSQDKWTNFDASGTGQVAGPHPVNLRTDRSYTISAWVRHSSLDQYARAAVGMGDTQFSPFLLGFRPETGKWGFLLSSSATQSGAWYALSDQPAQDKQWVHLTASYNAVTGTITLYVNGLKQHTFVNTKSATDGSGAVGRDAAGEFWVGRGIWTGKRSDQWKGDVDDARAYSGVLTDTDVGQLYGSTRHF